MQYILDATKDYPRFADGRIDYTNARVCFGVNCTVVYKNEVLLAKRSSKVATYPNVWSGISGFIDTLQPLEHIILNELQEEAGIKPEHIDVLEMFEKLVQADEELDREWHIYPGIATLKEKPKIVTNWENAAMKWVPIEKVEEFDLLPGYREMFLVLREKLENQ